MVVKFYNHTNTMRTCTDTMRTANDTPRIPVPAQHKRQLITGLRYFCISLNSTCFKIKINNKKYYVFMKITPLIGRRIRFGRGLHVNQPLQLGVERCGTVSVLFADVLIITGVKILHKCDEISLTVTRIAVRLTLKLEVALKYPHLLLSRSHF